jgi:hypothetical protein
MLFEIIILLTLGLSIFLAIQIIRLQERLERLDKDIEQLYEEQQNDFFITLDEEN